jgi:HD-like signal output (HDOD) protein/ActR/RegA family two-component response regulator
MPETKKHHILFVDDESNILQGLQRMLHPMRKEWEMKFVESGAEALSLLQREPFDVVVTDMRMPGMDGVQLLSEVKRQTPEVVRIALSGYSDHQMVLKSIPLAHQFLSKPCPPQTLISTISRACALGDLIGDHSLKKLVTRFSTLPSMPTLYLQMEQVIQSEESSVDSIAKIISKDPSMTAKVLQLANSAYFGLPRAVNNPTEAVHFIGLKALEALVLSVHIFAQFQNASRFQPFLDQLWLHSQVTAGIAEVISKQEGIDKTMCGHASMAGLLHDCGKLVLADNFPDEYEQALSLAKQERIPLWQVEGNIFGVHHGSVGAYLLGLWGLPNPIIEALAFHHQPNSYPQDRFNVLTAVHVANALGQEDNTFPDQRSQVDEDYLSGLGLDGRLPEWRILLKENVGCATKAVSFTS